MKPVLHLDNAGSGGAQTTSNHWRIHVCVCVCVYALSERLSGQRLIQFIQTDTFVLFFTLAKCINNNDGMKSIWIIQLLITTAPAYSYMQHHLWLRGCSTNTQTHIMAIIVSGVKRDAAWVSFSITAGRTWPTHNGVRVWRKFRWVFAYCMQRVLVWYYYFGLEGVIKCAFVHESHAMHTLQCTNAEIRWPPTLQSGYSNISWAKDVLFHIRDDHFRHLVTAIVLFFIIRWLRKSKRSQLLQSESIKQPPAENSRILKKIFVTLDNWQR